MAPSLISTSVFPGDDMSPEAIGTAASMIRFVGDQVGTDSADVAKTWSGIAASYDAPETGQLVAAMTPVKTSGATFDSHLGSAADALVTFADEVRTIKRTLEGIRGQANALLATIDANGKVGATGPFPGSDWWHDPVTFRHNEDLIAAVQAQADLLRAAERKCAGAIESLADGGGRHGENGGPGFSTVTAPAPVDEPWGHVLTGEEANELWEQGAPGWERGASKQALATGAGVLSFVGFDTSHFDPSSGLPRGTLSTGWSMHNAVTAWEAAGEALLHPVRTFGAAVKDFTAWDDWDRPGFALGEVGFNVLTLGLASAKVGSVGRFGAAGREAADAAGAGKAALEAGEEAARASRLARLAEVGQRVGGRAVSPTVDGLKTVARTTTRTWSTAVDRLDKVVQGLHHDLKVDEAPTKRPHVPEARDVSGTGDHAGHESSSHHPASPHDLPRTDHQGQDATRGDGEKHGGVQHGEHEAQGQHRFSEVNSSTVDPLRHVVHDGWEFKPEHPRLGPDLHDARIVKQAEHLDALHHRDALARAEGVDPKNLTVGKVEDTIRELRRRATTPDDFRRARELNAATEREYDTNRALHKISERMGTEAGKDFHESMKEKLVVGDHELAGRRDTLDTVGINKPRTVMDVVEEKGATSRLGSAKLDSGVKVEQGSTAYLNKLLHRDSEILEHFRKHPDDVQRLLDGKMELRYHVVRAKTDGTIWVERMKLNPDDLHLEDLLPAPVSAGR